MSLNTSMEWTGDIALCLFVERQVTMRHLLFQSFFHFSDCEGALQLDVVSSNLGDDDGSVHNVLSPDEGEWLSEEKSTGDQGFILRTRGCKRKITGFRIQNAAVPHATKSFRVSGASDFNGRWNNLLEGNFEENSLGVTFHLNQSVEVLFIKFELLSSHSGRGGGLRSFTLTTGKVI